MKKQIILVGIIVLLIAVGLSGCAYMKSAGGEATYQLDSASKINIYSGIAGEFAITGDNRGNVYMNYLKYAYEESVDLDKITVESNVINDTMNISISYNGKKDHVSIDCTETYVPKNISSINVTTTNGGIKIYNIDGYVSAITTNDDIHIVNVAGIINLITSNGNIDANIENVLVDGAIIKTSNGDITLKISSFLNADIELKTSNGNISYDDVQIKINESSGTYLKGTIGNGGSKIYIETSNGNIILTN